MINFVNSKMNRFTYKEWNAYFTCNDSRRPVIDFSEEKGLSEKEIIRIAPSIQAFQTGESSDGKHLLKAAGDFADRIGQADYRDVMRRFVKEENRHAGYLRKFMDYYQIKAGKRSYLDHIFRRLRQLGGIRCEAMVLVTAEMIALTYYDALANNTDSFALKSICRQMLRDEIPHVMFQSYTLSHFKSGKTDRIVRILLMETALFFVWVSFHQVYQAGGYGIVRYMKENLGYLRQSLILTESNSKSSRLL